MWRAMELAIAICKPKHIKDQLPDTKEQNKWTTDEDMESTDSDEEKNGGRRGDERVAGSLAINSLEYLQQVRI